VRIAYRASLGIYFPLPELNRENGRLIEDTGRHRVSHGLQTAHHCTIYQREHVIRSMRSDNATLIVALAFKLFLAASAIYWSHNSRDIFSQCEIRTLSFESYRRDVCQVLMMKN